MTNKNEDDEKEKSSQLTTVRNNMVMLLQLLPEEDWERLFDEAKGKVFANRKRRKFMQLLGGGKND